ncbi:uncharacterized protein LOC141720217 [Apium graveolens]|uniref:uncharacterized protein LOC141720217 n=1 Tax=Apium graveolens TaxID=4045 RepID=UPI003D7AA41A
MASSQNDNTQNIKFSVQLALGAKNKIGFIDGSLVRPADDSPDLQKWIRNDYMVTGWLLYSIDKSIAESFIFTPSARALWLEIQERYGHSNAPQLYEIHKSLMSIVQGGDAVVEYYNKLKKKLNEADQLKKLIQFVAGLNKSYDQAKINILSMDPIPNVNKVYHMIQQIEKQNSIVNSQSTEMSALLSVHQNSWNQGNTGFGQGNTGFGSKPNQNWNQRAIKDPRKNKGDRFCDFCKMKGHLKDQCFKLVGYPDWYKGKVSTNSARPGVPKFAANVREVCDSPLDVPIEDKINETTSGDNNATLYKEFLKFMNQNQAASADSSSAYNFAGTVSAFNVLSEQSDMNEHVWIIDTGASDHMAISLDIFSNTHKIDQPLHIALPDGSMKLVDTIGSVVLTPNLTLSNVFYVPEFKHNLLSVAQLLVQHQLVANF